MTTRTFQFYGQGWGPTTAEITVTLAGQTIYSGPIPTVPQKPSPVVPVFLFTASVLDVTDQGTFAMTVQPTVGEVFMSQIFANYVAVQNPIYTPEQWAIITDPSKQAESHEIISSLAQPPFSPAEVDVLNSSTSTDAEQNAILVAHGVQYMTSTGSDGFEDLFWQGDCRTNVTINGVPQQTPQPRPDGYTGDWSWAVNNNSVLAYDLNLDPGLE
jgi:hypothetical protein